MDEPGIADSPIASIDPKDAARAMAVEAAEDENGVGEFVEAIDAGDGITGLVRLADARLRGMAVVRDDVPRCRTRHVDGERVNAYSHGTGAAPSEMDSMEGPSAADRPVGDRLPSAPTRMTRGWRKVSGRPPKPRPVTRAFRMHGTWKRPGPRARSMPRMRHRIPGVRILRRPTANLWSPRDAQPTTKLRRMSMTR